MSKDRWIRNNDDEIGIKSANFYLKDNKAMVEIDYILRGKTFRDHEEIKRTINLDEIDKYFHLEVDQFIKGIIEKADPEQADRIGYGMLEELVESIQEAMQEADAMEEIKYQNTIYFKDGNSECLVFIGDTNVAEAMAEEEDWQYGTLALWGIDSKEGVRTIPKENILFIESKELEN